MNYLLRRRQQQIEYFTQRNMVIFQTLEQSAGLQKALISTDWQKKHVEWSSSYRTNICMNKMKNYGK